MAKNFSTQLSGQIGESLVVAELGRRGIIATAFSGNVPNIDIVAYANGATTHIQVKAWRTANVSIDARWYINISFSDNKQTVEGINDNLDGGLIYVFVRLGKGAGDDDFFILTQSELQASIFVDYKAFLDKHEGVRPRNPKTTHHAVSNQFLNEFKDNWSLIERCFQ